MLALPTSAHIGLHAICLLVRNTLATNLLPEIGLCAILTGGQRHSRDLPFRLTLDTWSATLSRPTLLLETGLRAMDDDDDTGDVHQR